MQYYDLNNLKKRKLFINSKHSLISSLQLINESMFQMLLVEDDKSKFIGTLTDGDIRRLILSGENLEQPVLKATNVNPIKVEGDHTEKEVINLMRTHKIWKIPVVHNNKVIGLYHRDRYEEFQIMEKVSGLIMAGGLGTRLRPYTDNKPKPLLEILGTPMIEVIIKKLRNAGLKNLFISIGYLGHQIQELLDDGSRLGVEITYLEEKEPLGTAGVLGNPKLSNQENLLVHNADVICEMDYLSFINTAIQSNSSCSMVVREHIIQNPFGVVETHGLEILGIVEKPIYKSFISAGINFISSEVIKLVEHNKYLDMPDLFLKARENNFIPKVFPIDDYWTDIGTINDLKKYEKK